MEPEPNNKQEGVDAKCGNDGPSGSMQVKPDDFKQDARLDSTLEEAARRRNLSTLNVKSIIHVSSDSKYIRAITKLAIQTLSFEVQAWNKFR